MGVDTTRVQRWDWCNIKVLACRSTSVPPLGEGVKERVFARAKEAVAEFSACC